MPFCLPHLILDLSHFVRLSDGRRKHKARSNAHAESADGDEQALQRRQQLDSKCLGNKLCGHDAENDTNGLKTMNKTTV